MEADIQAERDHQIEQEMINRRFADIMRQEYTVSPEIDPRYQNAKAIESKIEQLREMADHTTIPRYGLSALLYKAKTPFMPQDSDTLERQLLDVEAHIGGEIADAMFERNGGV